MVPDAEIKEQVRQFYDEVGWQVESDGFYQNASYEDLRPVAHEYIHKCHLRVQRHLNPSGHLLLDAGSGPIQYPEYILYSSGYQYRVCADISIVALQEARKRIGVHGLFVVCDVAYLPFKSDAFDGLISLHTLHHLPIEQHMRGYQELHRTLAPNGKGVVVNGWDSAPLADFLNLLIQNIDRLYAVAHPKKTIVDTSRSFDTANPSSQGRGTFVKKETAAWLEKEVGSMMPISIWCWRSVSVHFLRTFIHARLGGRAWLKLLYWLEERLPHFLGRNGQYPLVEIQKNS